MTLPPVDGWLIDFRTARTIFNSGSNERISHCVELCTGSRLHISHCEEKLFRSDEILKTPFINQQNCILEPDDDVFERCATVHSHPLQKRLVEGNETAIYLTAAALAKNFGVISDARSVIFSTVHDLCGVYGIAIFSADEYFAAQA